MTVSRRELLAALLGIGVAPAVASDVASAQTSGDPGCEWFADQNAMGYGLLDLGPLSWEQTDVREVSSPTVTETRYHDGSGTTTEGPAVYRSDGSWVSLVDGSTIS
jgi:hypothetical protein